MLQIQQTTLSLSHQRELTRRVKTKYMKNIFDAAVTAIRTAPPYDCQISGEQMGQKARSFLRDIIKEHPEEAVKYALENGLVAAKETRETVLMCGFICEDFETFASHCEVKVLHLTDGRRMCCDTSRPVNPTDFDLVCSTDIGVCPVASAVPKPGRTSLWQVLASPTPYVVWQGRLYPHFTPWDSCEF